MLISSFGCSYETADIEFGYTLSQARDKGNNLAFHLIQSFAPGEVDYEKAHEIGRQLADAVTKGQHEYVLTTHIDKGHIHNHIIVCGGEMATAKIQTVKGLRVEIFSRPLRKNTTRPLTFWIVETEIERELFSEGKCIILGSAD